MTTKKESVLNFIHKFTEHDRHGDVSDLFLNGCCYWFAQILRDRFHGVIVYDPVRNHFATQIAARFYDITGEVGTAYEFIPWSMYEDTTHKERLLRQCVNFDS